jgi:O-antigen/teichoic acid export membrane protein
VPPRATPVNRAVGDYLALVLSQWIRIPLGLASAALLAHLLGPSGMGEWALAVGGAALLHSALLNWMQGPVGVYGRQEWVEEGRLRRTWSGRWPWLAAGLGAAAILVLTQPGDWVRRVLGLPGDWGPLLLGSVVALWLSAEAQSLLQVTGRFRTLSTALVLHSVLFCASLGGLLAVPGARGRTTWALAASIGATLVVFGSLWAWQYRITRQGAPLPSLHEARRDAAYSWSLVPSFVLGEVSNWGDHVLVQAFYTPREVGLFQSAYQAMLVTRMLGSPFTSVFLNRLAANPTVDAQREFLRRIVPTVLVAWSVLVAALLGFMPGAFRVLLGGRFEEAVPALLVLGLSLPGAAATYLCSVLFSVQGRLGSAFVYHAAMTAANLGLSLVLLPRLGIVGSALATAVGYALSQTLYLVDQHRRLGVPARRPAWTVGVGTAFAAIQLALLDHPWLQPLLSLAAVALAAATIRRFGLLDPGVLDEVLTAVPASMRGRVRGLLAGDPR